MYLTNKLSQDIEEGEALMFIPLGFGNLVRQDLQFLMPDLHMMVITWRYCRALRPSHLELHIESDNPINTTRHEVHPSI